MCIDKLSGQDIEETKAYLATLSREELCEFMIAKSQNLLVELNQVVPKAEQATSSPVPLLGAAKKEVESIFGEEYFETLWALRKEDGHCRD